MKINTKPLVLALALVALAALPLTRATLGQAGAGPATPPAAEPTPSKLAVVNIVDLFDTLDEKSADDALMDKRKTALSDQVRAAQKQLEDDQKELGDPKLFAVTSPQYKDLQEKVLKEAMDLQSLQQYAQAKILMDNRIFTVDIYNRINAAVEEYARQNGIALVFVTDDIGSLKDARSPEEVASRISNRKIIFAHPTFDITKNIRAKMNTAFQLNRPAVNTPAGH